MVVVVVVVVVVLVEVDVVVEVELASSFRRSNFWLGRTEEARVTLADVVALGAIKRARSVPDVSELEPLSTRRELSTRTLLDCKRWLATGALLELVTRAVSVTAGSGVVELDETLSGAELVELVLVSRGLAVRALNLGSMGSTLT